VRIVTTRIWPVSRQPSWRRVVNPAGSRLGPVGPRRSPSTVPGQRRRRGQHQPCAHRVRQAWDEALENQRGRDVAQQVREHRRKYGQGCWPLQVVPREPRQRHPKPWNADMNLEASWFLSSLWKRSPAVRHHKPRRSLTSPPPASWERPSRARVRGPFPWRSQNPYARPRRPKRNGAGTEGHVGIIRLNPARRLVQNHVVERDSQAVLRVEAVQGDFAGDQYPHIPQHDAGEDGQLVPAPFLEGIVGIHCRWGLSCPGCTRHRRPRSSPALHGWNWT
jgi:hypothetical protein